MANKLTHVGIIRPTVPEPEIFWGSPQDVADLLGISYRSAHLLISGKTKKSKIGYRRMTEEEEEKYYEPPKPRKSKPVKSKYSSKKNWLITFVKDGKREGRPDTSFPDYEVQSGCPQDFVRAVGCNVGQVYRMINTYEGKSEKYPLKTIKGWRITRIRRYSEKPKLANTRRVKGAKL